MGMVFLHGIQMNRREWAYCQLIQMYNSILLGIKQEQFNRYSQAFNFFQSKSINMIINSRKMDYVVRWRDLQILDDETEYFKRYYSLKQTASRVLKLISYYEANMTPPSPNLILINTFTILETRKRKLIRLIVLREKSLARRAQTVDQEENDQEHMILQQLDESNFSEISSQKEEANDSDSYDNEPYYAYEIEDDIRLTGNNSSKKNLFSFKEFSQAEIILDFNEVPLKEQPRINILPPAPPPPQPLPPVQTASIGIQTLPEEIPPPKKQERQVELTKPVQIPQLKKEIAMTPVSQMGLRSELKKQNVVLTDSIEMIHRKQQREKGRGSTFMDYYNSQPVKSPSNILEKFIKRKK